MLQEFCEIPETDADKEVVEGESFRRISREDNLPTDLFTLHDPSAVDTREAITEDKQEPAEDRTIDAGGENYLPSFNNNSGIIT